MELVVFLALGVLAAVFVLSLIVLVVMCRRHRNLQYLKPNAELRFSKLRNENVEGLAQLSPLMAELLDKNSWVYDVTGLLQHCVALLRLCHTLSEKLSNISLAQAGPHLSNAFCDATHRVMPRFDDLLSAVASPHIDVRVLEARATALATVCWALSLPFSLMNPKYKEMLDDTLKEMDTHLQVLRQAADLAEKAEIGKLNIDWSQLEAGVDAELEYEEERANLTATIQTEALPLVDKSKLPVITVAAAVSPQTAAATVPAAVVTTVVSPPPVDATACPAPSSPTPVVVVGRERATSDERKPLVGNGHPVDPSV